MDDKLKIYHSFYWYDGPLLWIAEFNNSYYLLSSLDHDEYVGVQVSKKRADDLVQNKTTIKEGLRFPEQRSYFRLKWNETITVQEITLEVFKEDLNNPHLFRGGHQWCLYGKYLRRYKLNKRNRPAYKLRHAKARK